MFNFIHPRSVFPRKPVAAMVVRQSTYAAKLPTTLVIQGSERTAAKRVAAGVASPPKIAFSVSYSRCEYLMFVSAHLTATLAKRGKLGVGKSLPLYARGCVSVIGSAVFYFKRRKMPRCHFEIDATGIFRTTALGRLVLPWAEVVAVHHYAPGLLVAKTNGAMPLPFRCMTTAQIDMLKKFVETWKSESLCV